MMGFGYRLYPSYNGDNRGGKGIDKMIEQLIAKHDELPASSSERRLLFFAVALAKRRSRLLTATHELRTAFREAVSLPDHLHCIWTLPKGYDDFSTRRRQITMALSRLLPKNRTPFHQQRGAGIWQRRFWEHAIRDEVHYQRHVDYIYYNPVTHGCVAAVANWRYSSFHRFVRLGMYATDWAGSGLQCVGIQRGGNDGFRCDLRILQELREQIAGAVYGAIGK